MSEPERHYFKELRLQQFRGLLAVCREGGFAGASKALKITKASIWQQVRALEEEFGCALLETNGRNVLPTEAGLRLAEMSAPLVEGFDSIKEAFIAESGKIPAKLSVATTPSCLAHELRVPMDAMRVHFPDAHLTFHDRNSPAAIDLVEAGEADIGVAARFDEWPAKPTLEMLQFTQHPFVIAARTGHPLLAAGCIELKDLANYPLLLPGPAANCRPRLERVLREKRVWENLHIVLECSFPASLFEYVEAGLGIALTPVPKALLKNSQDGIATLAGRGVGLRSLDNQLEGEPVFYIRRRGWRETPIAGLLRKALFGGVAAMAAEK